MVGQIQKDAQIRNVIAPLRTKSGADQDHHRLRRQNPIRRPSVCACDLRRPATIQAINDQLSHRAPHSQRSAASGLRPSTLRKHDKKARQCSCSTILPDPPKDRAKKANRLTPWSRPQQLHSEPADTPRSSAFLETPSFSCPEFPPQTEKPTLLNGNPSGWVFLSRLIGVELVKVRRTQPMARSA